MFNLCIDIGNSSVKLCVFHNKKLIHKEIQNSLNELIIYELSQQFPDVDNVILSSVKKENRRINKILQKQFNYFIEFSDKTPVPIENLYKTKETLGKDRLAAIVGANNMYPESNVLVVDAGTAITFDFINAKKQYYGGTISPGLRMRFSALHQFTGKLPLVEPSDEYALLGDNTHRAILSGVINGIIFEIDGYIESLQKENKELITILTGGDAIFFVKKLKNTIFVDQNLVLTGLNRIIEYNVKKS